MRPTLRLACCLVVLAWAGGCTGTAQMQSGLAAGTPDTVQVVLADGGTVLITTLPDGGISILPVSPVDSGSPPDPDSGTPPDPDSGVVPPEPDAGPPGPCGDLATRLTTVSIDLSPDEVVSGSPWGWSANRPIHVKPLADGTAKVAWTDGNQKVHVTRLDGNLAKVGSDLVLSDFSEVRGFVAHDDGKMALLLVRGMEMHLVRLDANGTVLWDNLLVGDPPANGDAGTDWVDGWGHEGRLVTTGTEYIAYFGQTRWWGPSIGKHQGDRLMSFDFNGIGSGPDNWGWGCSHSLDLRLAWDGHASAPVCLSDCYANKAVMLRDSYVLRSEPTGGCNGYSDGELGAVVALPTGGFATTFASKEGRPSRDLGFVRLADAWSSGGGTAWVTSTDGTDETLSAMALYGQDKLLIGWHEAAQGTFGTYTQKLATLSFDGTVQEGPVNVTADWAGKDDFATYGNGDVIFPHANGSKLELTRVRYCTP